MTGQNSSAKDVHIGPKRQQDQPAASAIFDRPRASAQPLEALLAAAAEPLPPIDDPAFGACFDRFGDCRLVMLGEASHGSAEFYRARAAITMRLVREHGFGIVAVEADWPDAAAIDRHVRQRGAPPGRQPPPFQRFPRWMWRNAEFAAFVDALRQHNAQRPAAERVRFHGLDLYNVNGSIAAVLAYLADVDPAAARLARQRYGCLAAWQDDPATYGRASLHAGYAACEDAVVAQCRELLARELDWADSDPDSYLDATQNARLVTAAERYYRVMYHGGAHSWNLRDRHMAETLELLLDRGGSSAKAVVWAHNSHIGDARATEMGRKRDELNLGQLARERWGDAVALVGFGTHTGQVAAADDWDGPMRVKDVRPSLPGSVERLCHDAGLETALVDLRRGRHDALRRRLCEPLLERYIGVVYRPETERWSHYADSSLALQYDAWAWFDETRAVTPLGPEPEAHDAGDTWPSGL